MADWTVPATRTVGQILTAAFENTQVRDNFLQTVPAVVTTDGDIGVATAANKLERWPLLTATNRFVKHEYGGWEFNLSALTTNDAVGGASAGVAEIKTPVTQGEAEAGVGTRFSLWSPARVKEAIDALGVITESKLWLSWEQSGAHGILDSFNYTSITDGGAAGDTDHTIATDFSSGNYVLVGGANQSSNSNGSVSPVDASLLAGTFTTISEIQDQTNTDFLHNSIVGHGTQ